LPYFCVKKKSVMKILIILPLLIVILNVQSQVNPCFDHSKQYPVPEGFQYGSMGGFYTFDEAMAELDTMIDLYPEIISAKVQIGTSYEGRPIYSVKISDNPAITEDEPQAMYTSIHHSQEPMSLQQLIYYMYYLLENYGSDPEVTYLVNETELYFIPVVNPDGYVYNEQENPDGGGLHRKNRHTTMFSDGVDLNRNYGVFFGYDEIGSSSIGFHPWHRGDYAFSEPETQALKNFMENHEIIIDVNWHSYGNMIIYPWNYQNLYTEDSTFYELLAESMSFRNNYRTGTVYETYGYQSNGDADDWMYGETVTKEKSISITAEVGNADDGFWPDPSRIFTLCNETVWTNLSIAHHAHAYYKLTSAGSSLIGASSGYFRFDFQSSGLKPASDFTLTFSPISADLSFPSPAKTYTGLYSTELLTDSVLFNHTASTGSELTFEVLVNNGLYTFRDTFSLIHGDTTMIFYDNMETSVNWTGDDWGLTNEQSFSGLNSMTESPGGNYDVFQTSSLVLVPAIDLTNALHAVMHFRMRYDLENNYDYVQVFVSDNGGSVWVPVCGRLSKTGSDDEDEGQPVYHGHLSHWAFEEINLDAFTGLGINVKFEFVSDQSTTKDGFYFDDFEIIEINNPSENNQIKQDIISFMQNHDRISFSNIEKSSVINIYSSTGIIIYNKNSESTNCSISTENWPAGMYIYQIEGSQCGKFVIAE